MDIQQEITKRLTEDYSLKIKGDWLQSGTCPNCNKKELFANAEKTYWIKCGRENKCGWSADIKDLYPEIFEGFNKRYQPTETNPNATADAYLLHSRGFDLAKIKGWYTQGNFWNSKIHGGKGTATVRFHLDPQNKTFMERFVESRELTDPETGEITSRRAHFQGSHRGNAWNRPDFNTTKKGEVWLVEGILDAISLELSGQRAAAVLSCVNYPGEWLKQFPDPDSITFVWALDNDKAGKKFTRKHVATMRADGYNVSAAQCPADTKSDWNDLFKRDQLKTADLDKYKYHGALLIAENPTDKGLIIYHEKGLQKFQFDHGNQIWWFNLDFEKYQKAQDEYRENNPACTENEQRKAALKQAGTIRRLANCHPVFLYFQQNLITDESWYYCEIRRPKGKLTMKNTFTAAQIAGASEFKKRLLHISPGALYKGSSEQLDSLIEPTDNIKTVETIDFIGYSKEHSAYVYNDIAVHDGQAYPINPEDYYSLPKCSLKTLSQSVSLHINPEPPKNDWLHTMHAAFGEKSLVCLAYWLGTLFCEQIREHQKSYPFLEVVGEPGSGKSTLIEFLWKLLGRSDYEGFDPAKGTAAGRRRNFSQVSNMPVVLIEADRDGEKAKSFEWDELKTAYNGRSIFTRGVKNSGNETYEPPFRGAVVITQNAPVTASDAILQRIVHLEFTRTDHNPATKAQAEKLERMPLEDVSGFILQAIRAEGQVLDTLKKQFPVYESLLMDDPEINHIRLAKNHAQIMALVDALANILPIPEEARLAAQDLIIELAKARQIAIDADHPIVTNFWETYDWLNKNGSLNHSRDDTKIAVNLNQYLRQAGENRQETPPVAELKRHLHLSKKHKFQEVKAVNSRNDGVGTVYCWVFND